MPLIERHGMMENDLIPEAKLVSAAARFEVIEESDKLISF